MKFKKNLNKKIHKYTGLYLLFIPITIYFTLFSYYPFFKGIIMSFQENKLIGYRDFVGLENYREVLLDNNFTQAVVNSLFIGIADMILYFFLSLILALLINELVFNRLQKILRTIFFIPYLFSWAVIGGIWVLIFGTQGIANVFISLLGIEPIFFLGNPDYSRFLVISMGVWRSVGYYTLLYLTTIVNIDPTLYEAAHIDGANRWAQMIHITLPSLRGIMKTILILLSIGILTHFDEIFVMQNPSNKTMIRTLLIYVYESGIINFKMGLATAGASIVMIGTVITVFCIRKIIKYDKI